MKKILGISLLFLFTMPMLLQAQDSLWTSQLPGKILWQKVSSFGTLTVNTSEGLFGLDVQTGKINWKNKTLANIEPEDLKQIDDGPFFQVTRPDGIYIVELFKGKIIFDSRRETIYKIEELHILPKTKKILVRGYTSVSPTPGLFMFDLDSGTMLWNNRDKISMMTTFLELDNMEVLIATLWDIFKVNAANGEIIWRIPIDKKTSKELLKLNALGELSELAESSIKPGDVTVKLYNEGADKFIVSYEVKRTSVKTTADGGRSVDVSYKSAYRLHAADNGKEIWKAAPTYESRLGKMIHSDKGLIFSYNESGKPRVNLIDAESGTALWGKKGSGTKLKGELVGYVQCDSGLVIVCKEQNLDRVPITRFNLLDIKTGQLRLDKYHPISGKLLIAEVNGGTFLITTTKEVIIGDLEKNGAIELKKEVSEDLRVDTDNVIYYFESEDKLIYKINKQTAEVQAWSMRAIDFLPSNNSGAMEVRNGGIFISNRQNIAYFNQVGELVYQKQFPTSVPELKGKTVYGIATPEESVLQAAAEKFKSLDGVDYTYVEQFRSSVEKRSALADKAKFCYNVSQADEGQEIINVIDKSSGVIRDQINIEKNMLTRCVVDPVLNAIYIPNAKGQIRCYDY